MEENRNVPSSQEKGYPHISDEQVYIPDMYNGYGYRTDAPYGRYSEMPYGQKYEQNTGRSVFADSYEQLYKDAIKKAEAKKDPRKKNGGVRFAAGVAVIFFAVFGLICAVGLSIKGIASVKEKHNAELFSSYDSLLVPVAAVSPESFDDLSSARMADLIRISVWSIINSGINPNKYVYSDSIMCIPSTDVEAAYVKYFGTQRPIEHATVEGYGYEFRYSAEEDSYFIPMTTLEPIYTPRVVSVESRDGVDTVECEFVNAGVWKQDSNGEIVRPDADLSVRITFRSSSEGVFISAIRSLGMPETALPSVSPTTEPATAINDENTTEEKSIVITWN